MAAVSDNALDEGNAPPGLAKQFTCATAILNICGMYAHAEQEAECVDEDVAPSTCDLLACIKTLQVECKSPFCAALLLCESKTGHCDSVG